MIRFANWYFLLLIPIIAILVYFFTNKKKTGTMKFSSTQLLRNAGLKVTQKHKIGKIFIGLSLVLFIIGLARPQIETEEISIPDEGIDIAMVLDVSGSMESVDFEPSRLEVAKERFEEFIDERMGDRMALIIFGGTAYTRIPLTLDHDVINQSLNEVSTDSVNEEGTAIGMAISVGINRLKNSDAKTKIMVLATDGDNNAGTINPSTATQLASDLGIKIYTIGVGTDVTILPVTFMGVTKYQQYEGGLNETLLQDIAETTGGEYYRATDDEELSNVFDTINELEKSEFQYDHFKEYRELAFDFIAFGLVALAVGIFIDRFLYIQIP
jgi:Ca-activated chloride channel family protein